MDQQKKQQQQNLSEVAQFFERWDEEVEVIRRGLKGFAITSRHEVITRRMQSFADEKMIELMTLEGKKYRQKGASSSDITKSNLVTDQEKS
jgi:hypothetical protein